MLKSLFTCSKSQFRKFEMIQTQTATQHFSTVENSQASPENSRTKFLSCPWIFRSNLRKCCALNRSHKKATKKAGSSHREKTELLSPKLILDAMLGWFIHAHLQSDKSKFFCCQIFLEWTSEWMMNFFEILSMVLRELIYSIYFFLFSFLKL